MCGLALLIARIAFRVHLTACSLYVAAPFERAPPFVERRALSRNRRIASFMRHARASARRISSVMGGDATFAGGCLRRAGELGFVESLIGSFAAGTRSVALELASLIGRTRSIILAFVSAERIARSMACMKWHAARFCGTGVRPPVGSRAGADPFRHHRAAPDHRSDEKCERSVVWTGSFAGDWRWPSACATSARRIRRPT